MPRIFIGKIAFFTFGLTSLFIGLTSLTGCGKTSEPTNENTVTSESPSSATKSSAPVITLQPQTSISQTNINNLATRSILTTANLSELTINEKAAFLAIANAQNKELTDTNLTTMHHAYRQLKNEMATYASPDGAFKKTIEAQRTDLKAFDFNGITTELRTALTNNDEDKAAKLFWLGLLNQVQLNSVKADEYYLKAAAINKNGTKQSIYISFIKENFSFIFTEQYVQTRLEQTIELHNNVLGKHHPDTAIFINALADFYLKDKKYSLAEEYYERALSIWERSFSPGSEQLTAQYERLIKIYIALRSYPKAEELIARILENYSTTLSNSNPIKLKTKDQLASIYVLQEKYKQALPLFNETLLQWDTILDEEDPARIPHLNNTANVYLKLEQYKEAMPLYEQSANIMEIEYGTGSKQHTEGLFNVANIYLLQSQYKKALVKYQELHNIQKTQTDNNTIQILRKLGEINTFLANYTIANSQLSESLEIQKQLFPSKNPTFADTYYAQAKLNYATGDYSKAHEKIMSAIDIHKNEFGLKHKKIATDLTLLSDILYTQGQFNKAESFYLRSQNIRKLHYSPTHYMMYSNDF
ncbi:MAG: tetratricopeptide repeat protein, partial [Gammaproteobacteria bacterium]|nr:tetratricopeptide repeat protein [Gammaproteobacteria bacterium]